MKKYYKEKQIYCGNNYLEVDIIPSWGKKKRGRPKRIYLSAPKQRNLNDKNARRYFKQLINTNFTNDDFHLTCSYNQKNLPATIEEAEKVARNFIRRLSYLRNKKGLTPLKYIMVTEFRPVKKGNKEIRIHHHIIINGGLDRNEIEDLWRLKRQKGEKKGKKIGTINADRLQADEFGFEALARYLTKEPNGNKRWTCSQNLEKPELKKKDSGLSNRAVEGLCKTPDDKYFWEKRYKGYFFTECKPVYNDLTGWSLYLKMRRYKEE